jgi:hypothetical protein
LKRLQLYGPNLTTKKKARRVELGFTPESISDVTRRTNFQLDSNHDHYLNPEYVDIRAH